MGTVQHLTLEEIRALDRQDADAALDHLVSALRPGTLSPNGVAVAGTEGFLFIGDGSNRWEGQYLGQLQLHPNWIGRWAALFARRQEEARRRGVTLWNFVAPEKQVLYADKRWPTGGVSGAGRPVRHLLAALGPDARLIYPEAELLAARQRAPVFCRRNSHWTASGCCEAALPLLAALSCGAEPASLAFAYERLTNAQDLATHFFDPAPQEEAGWLALDGEVTATRADPARNRGAAYEVDNAAAPDPRTVMVFGDSYAFDAGLGAALSSAFARVSFLWSKSVRWDLVEAQGADLVVWESAERFLGTVPEA